MKQLFILLVLFISILVQAADMKEGYASNIEPSNFTSNQKAHFQIYRQIKAMRLNGTFRLEKCFEPKYKPFVAFVTAIQPNVAVEANNQLSKANKLFEEGNVKASEPYQKRAKLCSELNKLCLDAIKAFKNIHTSSQLDNLMAQYTLLEIAIRKEGLKLPKREWLTPLEAELAIQRLPKQK